MKRVPDGHWCHPSAGIHPANINQSDTCDEELKTGLSLPRKLELRNKIDTLNSCVNAIQINIALEKLLKNPTIGGNVMNPNIGKITGIE